MASKYTVFQRKISSAKVTKKRWILCVDGVIYCWRFCDRKV